MAELLVRNIPEETKRQLAVCAAQNNRSQSAEVVALLTQALLPEEKSWILRLREAVRETDGAELELPTWAPPRDLSFEDD